MIDVGQQHHRRYSVLDFGASPNADAFQDHAIQSALDACFLEGGGEVIIPAGRYNVKGLRVRSNTTLHLLSGAVLCGSRDVNDYFILKHDTIEPVSPEQLSEAGWERKKGGSEIFHKYGSRWHNALIRIHEAQDVQIIGEPGSIIDGQNCYDGLGEEYYRGPHGISIIRSQRVMLQGYETRHVGNWAHNVQAVRNLRVEGVTCLAGHDGVHLTSCEDVIVKNCCFYTGDDSVAGFNNKNVLVIGCEINTACSAFRFSGTNVLVADCHIFAPARYYFRGAMTQAEKEQGMLSNDAPSMRKHKRDNMLSLFTYYADYSVDIRNLGTNIVIRDCLVEGADRFLHFNYSGNEIWQNNKPLLDIRFENIIARDISMPMTAYGDAEHPVSIEMENIDFAFRPGFEQCVFLQAANFRRISLHKISIRNCSADALIKSWSPKGEGQLDIEALQCALPEDQWVKYTTEPFCVQPI